MGRNMSDMLRLKTALWLTDLHVYRAWPDRHQQWEDSAFDQPHLFTMLHSPAKVVTRTWRSLHTCGPALADTGISPRGRPGPEAQADTVQEVKDKAKSAAADPAGTLSSLGSAVKDAAVWTAQFAKETVTTVAGLGGQVLGNTRDDVLKVVLVLLVPRPSQRSQEPLELTSGAAQTSGATLWATPLLMEPRPKHRGWAANLRANLASNLSDPASMAADGLSAPNKARAVPAGEAADAAARLSKAQDQVTSARFYAIKQVAQDVDSLSDAQVEFAAHASSVLASLGLDQAAQQLRQSNAAAAEKLAAVKQQQAGLDLSGLLEDRLPGLLPGEGSSSAEGEAAG
ncbi:hypothetical protein V8C86DRAFT_2433530 [Haematococcus lacustris]